MLRGTSLALVGALLLGACMIGDPTRPPPWPGGGGDGGANNTCEDVVSPAPDGHHTPGTSCIAGGCHDGATAGAPRFYLAGTLYTSKAGTAPRPGAHMIVPTGTGNPLKLTVANNGNFWSETSMPVNTKPKASGCPNLVQMPTATTSGNCNSANCHDAGRRIALPL
jgi:hypothetical protein